jgi:hypothetical protein
VRPNARAHAVAFVEALGVDLDLAHVARALAASASALRSGNEIARRRAETAARTVFAAVEAETGYGRDEITSRSQCADICAAMDAVIGRLADLGIPPGEIACVVGMTADSVRRSARRYLDRGAAVIEGAGKRAVR